MAAVAGRKAQVKIPSAAIAFTDEATTSAGDGVNYQITNAVKRVWDATATITVKVGGSPVSATTYTLNRLTGTVVFNVTDLGRAAVTVSGSYLPLSVLAEARSYTYELTAKNDPDSAFGDDYVTRVQAKKDLRGSLSRWHIETYFSAALLADTQLVFQFYAAATASPELTCWGKLTSRGFNAVQDGLQEESLDFVGTLDADNRAIDSTTVVAAADELSFLRTNITGGDSAMLGIYSAESLTESGGAVSAIPDLRGGGFAPTMNQATGSKKPTVSGLTGARVVTFDGTDDEIGTALDAIFALNGACSLITVLQQNTVASGAGVPTAISDATTASRNLMIHQASGAGATIRALRDPESNLADSTVVISANFRLVIVSKGADATVSIDVPNQARVTTTGISNIPSGNNALTLGDSFLGIVGSGTHAPFVWKRTIWMNRQVTAGDITVLKSWLSTYPGGTLA